MIISRRLKACQFSKLLFTISFFSVYSLYAQEVTFIGKESKQPVEGVEVESGDFRTFSGKNGKIDISSLPDSAKLLCIHVNYDVLVITKSNIAKDGKIALSPKDTYLPIIDILHPLRDKINVNDEPHQITIVTREDIINEKPQSSADMLQHTGNVFVQKTQNGGGSPVMRGFEANKVLLVIDGVRMNNAIYRSGHLQNAITIDNSILSHSEIIFGPNSVLYGSDALGGVIHFHTVNPELSDSVDWLTKVNASSYFNSVDQSLTSNLNFSVGQKKWGMLGSYTNSMFNDYDMGRNRAHGYTDWGLQPRYVDQFEGKDSSFINPDPSRQLNVGYTQHDALAKLYFQPSEQINYTLNFQYSTSTNINRYDKLAEVRDGNLRFAEWYYGPQNRLLGSFKTNFTPNKKWLNSGSAILAYQRIDEDRINRSFNSTERFFGMEDVDVWSFNLDLNKLIDSARVLYYGLEVQYNDARSTAYFENINTLERTSAITRYPDGENSYLSSGLYIEYKQQFNPRLLMTTGLRYSFINAHSTFEDTSLIVLPFESVDIMSGAPSGSFGLNYQPDGRTVIKPSLSTGFRAPNIDDYGKVFENSGRTVIPNNNLKPEYALNAEVSFERILGKRRFTIGGAVYYTHLINAIVREDFSVNGVDSIFYDGEMTKIQANVNTNNAYIFGVNVFAKIKLNQRFNFFGTYNYTRGWDITDDAPLAHISPDFGKLELNYKHKKINTSVYSYYNFKKPVSEYGGGSDNLEEATVDGTPAWWTLNYKLSIDILEQLKGQFYATNILDYHYRQFSSAISAPGRSFKLGVVLSL